MVAVITSQTTNFTIAQASGFAWRPRTGSAPIVIKLILIANFLPEQLSFFIFGLRLTVTRTIFILITPLLVVRFVQKIATGRYRVVPSDVFVPMAGIWMIIALAETGDLQSSLAHGGPIALEFCIGYLATRMLLKEHGQSLSFANILCRVIAIVALLGIFDPLTGEFLIRNFASALTGYPVPLADNLYRFGILRATGPMEHSILFGIACAIGLLLATACPVTGKSLVVVACLIGAVCAICSAAIQGIAIGLTLLIYDRVFAGIKYRWLGLIVILVFGIGLILLTVGEPFRFIFNHLIFDAESGYYRLYTWQEAGQALSQSPWFGIGFVTPTTDDIPASVDSLWLWSALRFGIPGSLLIGLSIIASARGPACDRVTSLYKGETQLRTILGIIIFLILFWGFTVDFWGTDWVLIALLTGLRAHLSELGHLGEC